MSTNVLTPFSYAEVETPEVIPETGAENVVEVGETPEINEEISEVSEETPEVNSEEKWEIEQENQDDETSEKVLPDAQDDMETPATDETEEEDTENNEVDQPVEEIPEWWDVEEWNIWEGKENANVETGDLSLESLINPELLLISGDPLECGSWYVLNADWTWCELIQVTFDANGWSFSGGEYTKTVNTTVVEIPPIRYSHTANINDDWVASSVYSNNLSTNDVVTIPWATSLDIEVRFATQGSSYDWLAIYPVGITPTASNYSSATISSGKLAGHGSYTSYTKPSDTDATYHRNFIVSWDTAQFYFNSNSSSAYYGYYAVINWIDAGNSYKCEFDITYPKREWYIFQWWYTDTDYTQIFNASECLTTNTTVYAKWYQLKPKDIVIEATATQGNQDLTMRNYFKNSYTVNWWDGSPTTVFSTNTWHKYPWVWTYTIVLSLTGTSTRWIFKGWAYSNSYPLIPIDWTTMTWVKIVSMPSLADWFWSSKTSPGNSFFESFNNYGAIISLPAGSFDTSNITTAGGEFFWGFNKGWLLRSLPEWSFNISNIKGTVWSNFFANFNYNWKLTSLPEWSFNTSKITKVRYSFFNDFNLNWALKSLPEWSFDTNNITSTEENFFHSFNESWALTSLPIWSFNISKLSTIDAHFFSKFNYNWALTSLPTWSFNTSNISGSIDIRWWDFFSYFNYNWKLTSLPEWSFDIKNITKVRENFFYGFNEKWALESLPKWSFDTSNITKVDNNFFTDFNFDWALESLPEWSFNTSNISGAVWESFFAYFNARWKITSLPTWSFDISNITGSTYGFFKRFNREWRITSLPEWSFNVSNITKMGSDYFEYAFNSTKYTLNRKVLDIVSWGTAPTSKMNTFSYNQSWQCGVDPNWLVSPNGVCRITYFASWAIWWDYRYWWYMSNATNFKAGSWISVPRMEWYYIEWWYDASWDRIDTIIFPEMNGETLYVNRGECENGYTANHSWTACVLKEYSIVHDLKWWYYEDDWKIYEWNQVMTYTYNPEEDSYYNLDSKIIKRDNSKFIGWYMESWEEFTPWNVPTENSMVYAKYECNLWYIENAEKTACEKIWVKFDANGWKFGNWETKYIVSSILKQVIKNEVKYSHTANIDDEWNQDWNYENSLNTNEIITLTWAESIHVKVIYGWESANYDYVCIWTGNHPEYTAYNNCYTSVSGKLWWWNHTSDSNMKEYDIQWDTVTIAFRSDWGWVWDGYGYYAVISGDAISEEVNYEANDFLNIEQPTRNGYKFIWWYHNDEWIEKEFDSNDITIDRIYNVYAKWEKLWSSGWWGGGWSSKKTDEDTHWSAEDSQKNSEENTGKEIPPVSPLTEGGLEQPEWQTWSQQPLRPTDSFPDREQTVTPLIGGDGEARGGWTQSYSPEFQQAYKFAHENWITTKDTIQSAQMNGKLTRIAMAKMLSQYAINVLWQTPDTSKTIKFKDVSNKKDADYDNWVTLAYQLWIMWQNMPWNKFRPNDEVSRAEFATALSRLLYQTTDWKYKSTKEYYIPHMAKLYNEWIISNTDPSMSERRWYVMIMLMRSAK